MDLINELNDLLAQLKASLKQLRHNGAALAEAERIYKIKLRQEVMQLKADKLPATLINLIVYGNEQVAKARFDRDEAESVYKANLEAINVYKLQVRIVENQLEREWHSNNG